MKKIDKKYFILRPEFVWATRGPIEQFDRVHNRHLGSRPDLHHAPDVARCDNIRRFCLQCRHLAFLQFLGNFGLHKVIRTRGSTAQLTVARFDDTKADAFQKVFGICLDLLAVLQGTSCVVGNGEVLCACSQVQLHQHFGDVFGEA